MSGGQRVQGAGVIGALKDFKSARRTSGDITGLSSATWANLDTGLDLVLAAAVGDVIEANLTARISSDELLLDCATIVSGAVVNTFSTDGSESASSNGVPGWSYFFSTTDDSVGGSFVYTVKAGDVSNGTVTLRLRYRILNAAKTVYASSTNVLQWSAKNLGQVNVGSVLAPIFTPREIILSRVAALTVPNISETNIPWDTEVSDPSGAFAVPITAIVLPAGWGGIWTLLVRGAFAGGGVGTGRAFHQFLDGAFNNRAAIGSGEDATYASLAGVRYPDGQSLTVSVFHTAGASRTWTGRLEMHRIGD